MIDGRFDPACTVLFVPEPDETADLSGAVVPALLAYGATLALLGWMWLMSLP